jgi:hypothetical protein
MKKIDVYAVRILLIVIAMVIALFFLAGCSKEPMEYRWEVEYASVSIGCEKPEVTFVLSENLEQRIVKGVAGRFSYRFATNDPQKLKFQCKDCYTDLKIYINGQLVQQNSLAQLDPNTIYYELK